MHQITLILYIATHVIGVTNGTLSLLECSLTQIDRSLNSSTNSILKLHNERW